MKIEIKSALIGAIIPTIGSFAIFFLGNFSTQETIEKNTVKTLSGYFDSVDKDMSYEQALQKIYKENENLKIDLGNYETQIDESKEQLNNKQKEIDKQNSAEEINRIIQNATDYWNDSDYVQCLTLLNNSKSKSTDIEYLYEKYSIKYIEYVIHTANIQIEKNKYNKAISILKDAMYVVYDDSVLRTEIENIKNSKPQNFIEVCSPYEKQGYEEYLEGEFFLMSGKKRTNGFVLNGYAGTGLILSNLDGKYANMNLDIGHVDGSGLSDVTVSIYLDNKLYKIFDVKPDKLAINISLSVKNKKQIKITVDDGSLSAIANAKVGFANIKIK